MKELWERRGYSNLGLRSQDQAAIDLEVSLEKTMGNLSGNNRERNTGLEEDVINVTQCKFEDLKPNLRETANKQFL